MAADTLWHHAGEENVHASNVAAAVPGANGAACGSEKTHCADLFENVCARIQHSLLCARATKCADFGVRRLSAATTTMRWRSTRQFGGRLRWNRSSVRRSSSSRRLNQCAGQLPTTGTIGQLLIEFVVALVLQRVHCLCLIANFCLFTLHLVPVAVPHSIAAPVSSSTRSLVSPPNRRTQRLRKRCVGSALTMEPLLLRCATRSTTHSLTQRLLPTGLCCSWSDTMQRAHDLDAERCKKIHSSRLSSRRFAVCVLICLFLLFYFYNLFLLILFYYFSLSIWCDVVCLLRDLFRRCMSASPTPI